MIWEEVGPISELGSLPWRPADLAALLPPVGAFDEWMAAYKAEHRDARSLPVLSSRECRDYLARLVVLATTRRLSPAERFLHGQLVTRFELAVSRETSRRPGSKGWPPWSGRTWSRPGRCPRAVSSGHQADGLARGGLGSFGLCFIRIGLGAVLRASDRRHRSILRVSLRTPKRASTTDQPRMQSSGDCRRTINCRSLESGSAIVRLDKSLGEHPVGNVNKAISLPIVRGESLPPSGGNSG
jgi:hypothetical protein